MQGSAASADRPVDAGLARDWHWNPDLPIPVSPLLSWPPRPLAWLRWVGSYWLAISSVVVEVALAAVVFWLTQPDWETMQHLSAGWMATVWLRNLALLMLVAGGLHLWLYRFKGQGKALKFDAREMARNNRRYTFHDQVLDNMIWSLASGATVWTLFEIGYFWAAANGLAPVLSIAGAPVWSVIWFVLIPIWTSFHFYWVHRALHWPPLYRAAHNLHHRNINIGPWTGLSMHPIEHAFYFSSVLIHFVVPSDPIHVLFHFYSLGLNPAFSHAGFEGLVLHEKRRMDLGDFFHQLHHRYFECNYGTAEVPWDALFGSFHNGTPEAMTRIRARKKRLGR